MLAECFTHADACVSFGVVVQVGSDELLVFVVGDVSVFVGLFGSGDGFFVVFECLFVFVGAVVHAGVDFVFPEVVFVAVHSCSPYRLCPHSEWGCFPLSPPLLSFRYGKAPPVKGGALSLVIVWLCYRLIPLCADGACCAGCGCEGCASVGWVFMIFSTCSGTVLFRPIVYVISVDVISALVKSLLTKRLLKMVVQLRSDRHKYQCKCCRISLLHS